MDLETERRWQEVDVRTWEGLLIKQPSVKLVGRYKAKTKSLKCGGCGLNFSYPLRKEGHENDDLTWDNLPKPLSHDHSQSQALWRWRKKVLAHTQGCDNSLRKYAIPPCRKSPSFSRKGQGKRPTKDRVLTLLSAATQVEEPYAPVPAR